VSHDTLKRKAGAPGGRARFFGYTIGIARAVTR
jgi:hypothetical protein